ncbi:cupin domain-containing protein [Parathalassolituus penaei]|uniref:Cupin domain-containing protein n=1 Tax=Parathalassolituus penaei TaxID=2997323 RepID=A0A9X3IRP6_9GAMM|nr:cupin domain-containing protein [Parathalassolituus penaei]MCY0965091.1 cupin domain-containing protein [Parathalassolituus penaei]
MQITSLDQIPETGVSHNTRIRKQVIVANNQIRNVTHFSRAVFPAGEVAWAHSHTDMTEVFLIEAGVGEMAINGQAFRVSAGTCISVEPGDEHELRNVGKEELVVLYFGVLI